MNKINNSKKTNVEQLYKILDYDSKKTQSIKDEKILKSLSIRLRSSSQKLDLEPKVFKGIKEKDIYSWPTVPWNLNGKNLYPQTLLSKIIPEPPFWTS